MPKILLEVHTPSNGKKYEIVADDRITAADFAQQIAAELEIFDSTAKLDAANMVLADKNTGEVLKKNIRLKEQNVKGGHTLILL